MGLTEEVFEIIISNLKKDEELFNEVVNFLNRQEKREVLTAFLKRVLIEASEKIYS
ncbi:MAG: hypothetical protein QXX38_01065 [Candidatus Aenigmatarchaeota archaeon]